MVVGHLSANQRKHLQDGITLPGMLDLEAYPGKQECYNLSPSDMVAWIRDFADTYHQLTRYILPIVFCRISSLHY